MKTLIKWWVGLRHGYCTEHGEMGNYEGYRWCIQCDQNKRSKHDAKREATLAALKEKYGN